MRGCASISVGAALLAGGVSASGLPIGGLRMGEPAIRSSPDVNVDLFSRFSHDDRHVLELHKKLVETRSTSGSEEEVANVLSDHLKALGWTTLLIPTDRDIVGPNLLAWPGKTNNTRLLLSSHIDTVPPYIPYRYDEHEQTVWGRGSSDAKASVAVQISALQQLIAEDAVSADDVAVLYVSGEEVTGPGMQTVSRVFEAEHKSWPSIVFGEPTEGKLARGHKGYLVFNITASGKPSHSGYPWLGSSATEKLVNVLHKLQHHSWHEDPELGLTTFNIGHLEGGLAANVVPAHAWAWCSVRISGDFDGTLRYLRDTIAEAADISFDLQAATQPVRLDTIDVGLNETVVNYSTDVPNLSTKVANGSRLLYGPGSILVAHADNEHIAVKDLLDSVDGYKTIVKKILSDSSGTSIPRDRKDFL